MKYLANLDNLVRDATLTATGVVPSAVIYRTDSDPKTGGGQVTLAGGYTGPEDATYEVEIVDNAATVPIVSQPVFAGVGNGVMSGVTVSGVAAQQFTITLEDLGTPTRAAYAPFQGVNLVARTPGAGGNAITLTVDVSGLVATATQYALQDDIRAGTNEYVGDTWNFGAATLNPDGTIPDTAPRLRFGLDPQVYRAYRFYRTGQYVYAFSPAPMRDVAAGAPVWAITGARTVTITDGVSTDTLTAIVSLYDCLTKIRDGSTLIAVDGAIVNDKLPGGQGATDLSAWTQPYIQSIDASGSDFAERADIGLTAGAAAPTEALTIRCTSATTPGAEQWSVTGDVSGTLDPAVTGVAYADGAYTFLIPEQTPDAPPAGATITVTFIPVTRSDGQPLPNVSIINALLGNAAVNGTWDFVYTPRPPAPCTEVGSVDGGPSSECLGIVPPSGGGATMSSDSRLRRYQQLADKMRQLTLASTDPVRSYQPYNLDWYSRSAAILKACLDQLPSGTLALTPWVASTAYVADQMIWPNAAGNGYRYACTVAGTSGATAPTWPTTVGATVTDGGVTWQCIGKIPWGMWDDVFAQWETEADEIVASWVVPTATTWQPQMTVFSSWHLVPGPGRSLLTGYVGLPTGYVVPSVGARNGWMYQQAALLYAVYTPDPLNSSDPNYGTWTYRTDSTEPTWPTTASATVSDLGVEWGAWRQYWQASHAYVAGAAITGPDGRNWQTAAGGTSGTSEPAFWSNVDTLTDGSVTWASTATTQLTSDVNDTYFDRYRQMCTDVLAAAGIDANFDAAGAEGDGCWQDVGDSNWWVYQGDDGYLPVFNNVYYHASVETQDADGKPVYTSTKEFGFGPRIGCTDLLLAGDVLRVRIDGVDGVSGRLYQTGDQFLARIVRATPVEFGGGQIGNDTLTWSVFGSVAGRLNDYALLTTAPAAYSDAGLGFLIVPGGIPFALGDAFAFSIEGGRYHWRKDGGAWSATVDVTPTAVIDAGLTATFVPGVAPSWATGDKWTFEADAANGTDGLRQPTDARMTWTGATLITVNPPVAGAIAGVFIGDHTMPETAIITLLGSDDGFVTTPLVEPITWAEGNIWHPVTAAHAEYRLSVDTAGSIQWLWLGAPFQPTLRTGVAEQGTLTKRWRLPSALVRQALGATVAHSALTEDAVDALVDRLAHAGEFDEGRLGIVTDDASGAIVALTDDPVEVTDEFSFQAQSSTARLLSVQVQFNPTP